MKSFFILAFLFALGVAAYLVFHEDAGGSSRAAGPVVRPASAETVSPLGDAVVPMASPERAGDSPNVEGGGSRGVVSERRSVVPSRDEFETRTGLGVATVSGGILAASGPVPGAIVRVVKNEKALAEVRCEERGRFTIQIPLPLEKAFLQVLARGHATLEVPLLRMRPGENRELGNVRVQRSALLKGIVIGQSGKPVVDAQVQLRYRGSGQSANHHVQRATTDSKGRFAFSSAPLGRVGLNAIAEGHGESSLEHKFEGKDRDVKLQLGVEFHLRARVFDQNNVPVEGLSVTVLATGTVAGDMPPREQRTDAEGRVHFRSLGTDELQLRIVADGYRPVARTGIEANGVENRIDITRWPCVSGRIRAGAKAPPEGARIEVLPSGPRGDLARQGGGEQHPVASDGTYRVCGVKPGQWVARVEAPGFAPTSSRSFQVGWDGDVVLPTIALLEGGGLELSVEGDGQALPNATIEVFLSPPPLVRLWMTQPTPLTTVIQQASTNKDGKATFEHLPMGQVWVVVRAAECVPAMRGPFTIREGGTSRPDAIAVDRGGMIHGRVRDESGQGVAGAIVLFTSDTNATGSIQVTSEPSGRYVSPPLPPGTWKLRLRSRGGLARAGSTRVIEVRLAAGGTEEVDLTL